MPRQHLPQPYGGVCNERLGKKAGLEDNFEIDSAATSTEELGNPIYSPARRMLERHGISCSGRRSRRLTKKDYEHFDLLIAMDSRNLRNMQRMLGDDVDNKIHLLLDYTSRGGEVSDPWYTDDFESTWRDVDEGCRGLFNKIMEEFE